MSRSFAEVRTASVRGLVRRAALDHAVVERGLRDGVRSWGKWAVEVKTGRFQLNDLAGLLELTRRQPGFKPLVICRAAGCATAELAEIPALTWQQLLLDGPPTSL